MSTPRTTRQSQRTTTSSTPTVAVSPPSAEVLSPKSAIDMSALRSAALKTKKRKSVAVQEAENKSGSRPKTRSALPSASSSSFSSTQAHDTQDVDMDGADTRPVKKVFNITDSFLKDLEDGEISDDEPSPLSIPPSPPKPAPAFVSSVVPASATLLGMPPPTLASIGVPFTALPPHAFPPFPPSRPASTPTSQFPPLFPPPLPSAESRFPPPSPAFLEAVNAGPVKIFKNKKGQASASLAPSRIAQAPGRVDPVAEGAAKLRSACLFLTCSFTWSFG